MFDYTVVLFIIDQGIKNIQEMTDEDVAEMVEESLKKEQELREVGKLPIMTTEYKKEVVERAREICSKDTMVILTVIKKELKKFI